MQRFLLIHRTWETFIWVNVGYLLLWSGPLLSDDGINFRKYSGCTSTCYAMNMSIGCCWLCIFHCSISLGNLSLFARTNVRKLHSSAFAHTHHNALVTMENWRFGTRLLAARWQKKDKINWIRYMGCQDLSWIWLDDMAWNFHTGCLHDKFCLKINLSPPVTRANIGLSGVGATANTGVLSVAQETMSTSFVTNIAYFGARDRFTNRLSGFR